MEIIVNGLPFNLRAVGWGSADQAQQALQWAADTLVVDPHADLNKVAVEAALGLRCLRGSFQLKPLAHAVGKIETRIAGILQRSAATTRPMAAKELARRLELPVDIGTCRKVGAALRIRLGSPRSRNGLMVWDLPDVWG